MVGDFAFFVSLVFFGCLCFVPSEVLVELWFIIFRGEAVGRIVVGVGGRLESGVVYIDLDLILETGRVFS